MMRLGCPNVNYYFTIDRSSHICHSNQMGRTPQQNELTVFGIWLVTRGLSYEWASKQLGVTRQYIQMLATNKASLTLEFASRIEAWTKGIDKGHPVLMSDWL